VKLSSQEEYGLRCLLQIARQGEGGSLTIPEISHREGISSPNVAKILRILRRADLVRSTRGKSGGYHLSRPPAQIAVADALGALGGRFYDASFCEKHSGLERQCLNQGDCSIRPVLRRIQDVVDHVLGRLTLESLLRPEAEVAVSIGPRPATIPVAGRAS
jgi:Rrf2 family protein